MLVALLVLSCLLHPLTSLPPQPNEDPDVQPTPKVPVHPPSHPSPSAGPAAPTQSETLNMLGSLKELLNKLLDSSKETQTMIKSTYRTGKEYVANIQQEMDETSQEMISSIGDMTSNLETYNKPLRDIYRYRQFMKRTQDMGKAVQDLYSDMSFNSTNLRFNVIFDQISLNTFATVCSLTNVDCDQCKGNDRYMMCQVCCDQGLYGADPVTIAEAMGQETGYPLATQANHVFLNSMQWLGLHPVYQSYIGERQSHQMSDVAALMNQFNWLNDNPLLSQSINSLRTEDICGHYVKNLPEGRVVGGTPVRKTGRFPWQLSLATGFFGFFYQHRCGAVLINENWVLTAAHCMRTLNVDNTYVMAGFLAVNNRDTAQIRRINRIVAHENFIPDLYEQDLAMLRLAEPIQYNTLVLPVCLPPANQDHLGMVAVLSGWGRMWNDGPLSEQLQFAELPVISNAQCMEWYEASGSTQFIPDYTFLCAGYESGVRDACNGDSGGPLVTYRADHRAELTGAVSWGIGCGTRGRPGVYTRISRFIPWILQTMEENNDNLAVP